MNILLVSQCSGRALTETRRILDQFAERKGERTWQTPITQEGLNTLRKLLRQKARKNTAVACHWIRGKDHSELLWIVGNARQFSATGTVPTNTTTHDIRRSMDENDWHTGEDIKLLAAMAALMHDLGKVCAAFQNRLRGGADAQQKNLIRHEWISLRLFQAFVGSDDDAAWLERLASTNSVSDKAFMDSLQQDGLTEQTDYPLANLPPLAAAIGWLILSHHRLPAMPTDKSRWGAKPDSLRAGQLRNIPGIIDAEWNERTQSTSPSDLKPYWAFEHPTPVTTEKWQNQAAKVARRLQARRHPSGGYLDNAYLMHLTRLSLMLADHHYSSLTEKQYRYEGEPDYPVFANTDRKTGAFNQPLDEHILGVMKTSMEIAHNLPGVERYLPRLGRHKGFRKRSSNSRFRWQDHAFDLAESLRQKSQDQGFFGINMASTGCGKTLANGRILYALADPNRGARFSIALGLRTLTLQTGQAYRQRLGLGEDELAIRVGGAANRVLHDYYEEQAEKAGSASSQGLMSEDSHVYFEGNIDDHPLLNRVADDPHTRSLLSAPILSCTVDHLMPATESLKSGHQIAPMLRLLSSDLVLDEIDDFALNDLHALTRLTFWAGLLGTRLILSSATITPDLAMGLFDAYRAGRAEYQKNRGESSRPANVCCAWFDEHQRTHHNCDSKQAFGEAHAEFAHQRTRKLSQHAVRRRGALINNLPEGVHKTEIPSSLAKQFLEHSQTLHGRHHTEDPKTGKRVSFGLIRMANIDPLIQVAEAMYALEGVTGTRIHLCVYHSQFPLLVRSAIEHHLDRALSRSDEKAVFELPEIRGQLDSHPEPDQLFIVLGSPVTEVGRDHDYDWAIVEPSSMRSIIQLAGRVVRHRTITPEQPNVFLLDKNLAALKRPAEPAFMRPGFEGYGQWQLRSHSLSDVLTPDEYEVIDSRPRLLRRPKLDPQGNLCDLEHARLEELLVAPEMPDGQSSQDTDSGQALSPRQKAKRRSEPVLGAYSFHYLPYAHLTGVLQQWKPFRERTAQESELVLLPDETEEDFVLHEIANGEKRGETIYRQVEKSKLHRITLNSPQETAIGPWVETDYMTLLNQLADNMEMDLMECAAKFGKLSLRNNDQGWRFNPLIGFSNQD
ncbi:type I-F CRISPR-associated helicase Cas3f [Halomonadaceae bacterium KBTZ08]